MKTCYILSASRTIADLVAPGELTENWTITRINVPREHRGLWRGSTILRKICADADAEQITLQLAPAPSDGLNYQQLIAWYERYGFVKTSQGYMKRDPKKVI